MSETLQNVFSRKKADPTQQTQNASLFEKLGGAESVSTAVDIFYRKVMRDARINYFFFGVNITEQAEKQKAFLTMAFGGPHAYTGRDMHRSHAKLINMGLNDRHFDIVMEHLKATLEELGVESTLIENVLAIAESTREDVMGRRAAPPEPSVSTNSPDRGATHAAELRRRTGTPIPSPRPVVGTVGAIMATRCDSLSPEASLQDAAEIFIRGNHSSLPVVDTEGKFLGIVTATDILKNQK
jgi:hemoglobin